MMKKVGQIPGFTNIQIKKSRRWDFGKLAKIYADEFSKPPYNEPWTLRDAKNKIKIFSRYCDVWKVVYEYKDIIGFVVVNPNHWFPGRIAFGEDMAIKREFQGKKVGTVVMKSLFIYYKRKGFESFMGLSNKNSKAFKLWKKLGIKESKENLLIEKKLK